MSWRKSAPVLLMMVAMVACSSGERKANKAQAQYTKEKTKTLQEYKECIDKAQGDDAALEQCELLLKAVQAAEGAAPPE